MDTIFFLFFFPFTDTTLPGTTVKVTASHIKFGTGIFLCSEQPDGDYPELRYSKTTSTI